MTAYVRGEDHHRAKLTEDDVKTIRRLHNERLQHLREAAMAEETMRHHRSLARHRTLRAIAESYGIHPETCRQIVSREDWGHVR